MQRQERAPAPELARRLRDLRVSANLSQKHLADAFKASVPLISSWETGSASPPAARLDQYATFFATERSFAGPAAKLFASQELTAPEAAHRRQILDELSGLRNQGSGSRSSTWHLPVGRRITIISSHLRDASLQKIPDSDPTSPDFVESYKYADLDALIELHGHIRAVNPDSQVNIRTADEVVGDDLQAHVVVLGGVELNAVMRNLIGRIRLPVTQHVASPTTDARGYFAVDIDNARQEFAPTMTGHGSSARLLSDVALFYRGVNPNDEECTLTICNGMFARGTYGAVRALTHTRFQERNEGFIHDRLSGAKAFCILSHVSILNRQTLTPDWTSASQLIYTWSEPHAPHP